MRCLAERSPPPRPSRPVNMWLCSSAGKERLETEVWKSVAHRCPYGAWGTGELPDGRTKRQGLSTSTKGREPRLNHQATRAGKATKADWLEGLTGRQEDNQENVASRSQHSLVKQGETLPKWSADEIYFMGESTSVCTIDSGGKAEPSVGQSSLCHLPHFQRQCERPVFHHLAPRSMLQS